MEPEGSEHLEHPRLLYLRPCSLHSQMADRRVMLGMSKVLVSGSLVMGDRGCAALDEPRRIQASISARS